jgi:tight adherence protein C
MEKSMPVKIGMCVGAAYLGLQAPMLFLKNAISKRQLQIKRAFPDALDLLLICIESGMSIETRSARSPSRSSASRWRCRRSSR